MKFRDKNGNIFIPTSKFTEEQMRKSGKYQEIDTNKENNKNKQNTTKETENKKEE